MIMNHRECQSVNISICFVYPTLDIHPKENELSKAREALHFRTHFSFTVSYIGREYL